MSQKRCFVITHFPQGDTQQVCLCLGNASKDRRDIERRFSSIFAVLARVIFFPTCHRDEAGYPLRRGQITAICTFYLY